MTTLTVTSKGQVTLRKDILRHLGVNPGDQIEVDLLPGSQVRLASHEPKMPIEDFVGLLAHKANRVATLEEINQAIADGWAGQR